MGGRSLAVVARRITNRGSLKVIGKFPSLKMNTAIWWESQLERDYIYLLEIDPDVLSYQGQPFTIAYSNLDKRRKYTPDFLVSRKGSKQIIEVKPAHQVSETQNTRRFQQAANFCKANNLEFVVVTEKTIRVQPRLDNIKLLYKYARVSLSWHNYIDCLEYFRSVETKSLLEAEQDLEAKGIRRNYLLRLLSLWFSAH
ncbi:MAG: TnsA endonuclease N-terminal domain-containing protein [Waterburya sp.]